MNTQTITPDVATLSGQLSVWQDRARQAEKRASDLEARLTAQSEKMAELIFLLLKHGVAIPRSIEPTVNILSGDGWLLLHGAMRFETGAAADEIIVQLMDHARKAFPADFPGVF